jgi:hypothetical protein
MPECKQCHKPVGTHYIVLSEHQLVYLGDRDQDFTVDSGLFCSGECVADYLVPARKGAAAS